MEDERLVAGRYRLAGRIGSGGMGIVWQGYDERLHRKVAVKQVAIPAELSGPQTDQARRQVMREGRIAAKLQHPNVIAVYDVTEEAGHAFLIMEYLPATSLAELLRRHGPLPPTEVARIGAEVADALAAAHAAGVVHRDVKPGNVLLAADGTAKVTDFGISRVVEDATVTGTGLIAGTPAYLSPEVAKGLRATYKSDVFSLGATLYTAIEGIPPAGPTDNAMAVLYRVANGQLAAPTKAGPLTGLLTDMLSVDPARRPAMAEVHDRLRSLTVPEQHSPTRRLEPVPVAPPAAAPPDPVAAPASPAERPQPPPAEPSRLPPAEPSRAATRRRAIVLGAAALVLLAVVGGILLLSDGSGEPRGGSAAPAGTSSTPAASSSAPAPQTSTSQRVQPPATSAEPAPPPPAQPADPAGTITGYYALMPGNLQQAWTWLTPRYQQSPAGGWGGYQTFWGRINTVRVSGVQPRSGNTVEAVVEYSFKDGRVVRERHRYTLINQDGRWLIDQSSVLSSQTL